MHFPLISGELIARVNRAVHVARRVHAHRDGAPFHVHRLLRKADARAAISFHAHLGRVPHLERVAADGVEAILREHAAGVARRGVERVRPDAVAAYVAQLAARDAEIAGAFFQQNAAGGVVAARRVARPAVGHPHAIDRDLPRPAHQHGEARDFAEAHVLDGELRNALRQHAVARREAREGHVVPRQPEARFQLSRDCRPLRNRAAARDCRAPRSARARENPPPRAAPSPRRRRALPRHPPAPSPCGFRPCPAPVARTCRAAAGASRNAAAIARRPAAKPSRQLRHLDL